MSRRFFFHTPLGWRPGFRKLHYFVRYKYTESFLPKAVEGHYITICGRSHHSHSEFTLERSTMIRRKCKFCEKAVEDIRETMQVIDDKELNKMGIQKQDVDKIFRDYTNTRRK